MSYPYVRATDAQQATCTCPPSHAHTYVGRCRWSFHLAGGRHICDCTIPEKIIITKEENAPTTNVPA